MVSRDIPDPVRLALRREVHWGCPVQGCGSPFLGYHHFDPPFAEFKEGQEHDPKGIIALCLAHAKMADIDTWTQDQLQHMKLQPYLTGIEVAGRVEWLRQDIMLQFGDSRWVAVQVLLQVHGERVIWVDRDSAGNMLLNMEIIGSDRAPLLRMRSNEWQIFGDITNLEAQPSGRSIQVEIPAAGFALTMEFRDKSEGELRSVVEAEAQAEAVRTFESRRQQAGPFLRQSTLEDEIAERKTWEWKPYKECIKNWPILEVTLTGRLPGRSPIILTPKSLQMFGNTFHISGFGTKVGIAID